MQFEFLTLSDWKQFESIEIDFHNRLTVLTGANGAGKTTILNILARHFGWNLTELSTPAKDSKTGFFRYFTRWFKKESAKNDNYLGKIKYSNGLYTELRVPNGDVPQYHISFTSMQGVRGINIPSHRPVFCYQQVANVATQKRKPENAYQLTHSSYISQYSNSHTSYSHNYYIKETLLNWAIGGGGNEFMDPDPELKTYFNGFQDVLKKLLPKTLKFQKIAIRNYEIVLETDSGDFMIDAVSGGISAIIDLGWMIYNCAISTDQSITVLIDEVENHLHATMQRSVLPNLLDAFPNVQFIVSTHSPLVVGSVKDSNVYAFLYNENNKVYTERLDLVNKAKSATEILIEVLGVPFTMPIWVENNLNQIVEKYVSKGLDADTFTYMRKELKEIGLENIMPIAMQKTIQKDGVINDKDR